MKTEKLLQKAMLSILFGVLCVNSAQAEEDALDGYVMTVYSNMAHGSKILDGESEMVVDKLARRYERSSRELAGHINLCVAYVKTKQLDKATAACDAAIAVSISEGDRLERNESFGVRTTTVADTGRAIALTNRGVLYAISGDRDEARMMFEMAMKLESAEESAQLNLTRLGERTGVRDS